MISGLNSLNGITLSTESDLWQSCDNKNDHSEQGKARVQVHQQATGPRAVQQLGDDEQHHQAVGQSQQRGTEALKDQDERQEADRPLADR